MSTQLIKSRSFECLSFVRYVVSKSGSERSIKKHLIFLVEQVNVGLWELYWRDHAAIDLSKGTA